jgi:glyoxylase-like metal-dependent hydrolase (beta-lactamase superfamily II)
MRRVVAGPARRLRVGAAGLAIVCGAGLSLVTRVTAQQQDLSAVQLDVQHVSGNVHMIAGAGGNTTVFSGPEGVMVVDTQFAPLSDRIIAAVTEIAGGAPIRWIVNTHLHGDHIGGNEALARAGRTRAGGNVVGDIGAAATATARIIAHENVLLRLSGADPALPAAALPTDTFFVPQKDLLFNGEAVQMFHQPDAHTDGDIIVHFRKSDVIATGDLFTTVMYPFIDEANGGTIDGYIKALNNIIAITVPSNVQEGGTMVIPGHGRVADEMDVVEYRNMVTIVRDRIREYVRRGLTLEQVKAQKPTLDFDPRYGTTTGFWTTDMFIEVIYRQMLAANPPAKPAARTAPRRGN